MKIILNIKILFLAVIFIFSINTSPSQAQQPTIEELLVLIQNLTQQLEILRSQLSDNPNQIVIGKLVTTSDNLRVRSTPNGNLIGTQTLGASGTVTSGPVSVGGYIWWEVNYQNGMKGWSASNWLMVKKDYPQPLDFAVANKPSDSNIAIVEFMLGSPCSSYSVDWGDGNTTSRQSRNDASCMLPVADTVEVSHTYDKAGTYTITVRSANYVGQKKITVGKIDNKIDISSLLQEMRDKNLDFIQIIVQFKSIGNYYPYTQTELELMKLEYSRTRDAILSQLSNPKFNKESQPSSSPLIFLRVNEEDLKKLSQIQTIEFIHEDQIATNDSVE